MAIFVYTGKLGSGKSLCAVGRVRDYLNQGRRVATNIDLKLHRLISYKSKECVIYRIPDRPTVEELNGIGLGHYEQNEEMNGLIVLDECAQFLNTRNYRDGDRNQLIEWFVHARKRRWDVIFVIQHLNALDKQFRDMFAEHIVYCNRLDRLKLPFGLFHVAELLGFSGRFPKLHRALVMYGQGQNAIKVDSYLYTGKSLYPAFDTEQAFDPEHKQGLIQLLPPYYTHGVNYNGWHQIKKSFISWSYNTRVKMRSFFLLGLFFGWIGLSVANNETFEQSPNPDTTEISEEVNQDQQIYITGSAYPDYFFIEKNGVSWQPELDGFKIWPRGKCHIILIKNKIKKDVYCGAFDSDAGTASAVTSNFEI
ncbi:MAG: hypothetical protein OEY19_09160 [Gammaproteobacteria bacterium]|nr:hypothetical protein [Gammaproteobacteria bacterium]MDH5629893.1 hypothetical protein [Gammaproteobacteria bacterium]